MIIVKVHHYLLVVYFLFVMNKLIDKLFTKYKYNCVDILIMILYNVVREETEKI